MKVARFYHILRIAGNSPNIASDKSTSRYMSNLEECIGDFASTEPMKGSSPDGWQLSVELNA